MPYLKTHETGKLFWAMSLARRYFSKNSLRIRGLSTASRRAIRVLSLLFQGSKPLSTSSQFYEIRVDATFGQAVGDRRPRQGWPSAT